MKMRKQNHMFIWDRLMNEACKSRHNNQEKQKKREQQEQIIIHGTVESLDKHKQQMSV